MCQWGEGDFHKNISKIENKSSDFDHELAKNDKIVIWKQY